MQYVGGKHLSGGTQIAAVVNRVIAARGLTTYSEPFCGGLSVTRKIKAPVRLASDACTTLITLYCAIQAGWSPPDETYATHYRHGVDDVSAAWAAANSLANKLRACADVKFSACEYHAAPLGEVVYCDPPYADTLGYPAVGAWDAVAFWQWARETSTARLVAVSERAAPVDFEPLRTFSIQNRIATGTNTRRTEHLYVHASQIAEWRELTAAKVTP